MIAYSNRPSNAVVDEPVINEQLKGFGQRVRKERERLKWSQRRLAREIEISAGYLPRIERGEAEVKFLFLVALAEQFDVNVRWLATGEGLRGSFRSDQDPQITDKELQMLEWWRNAPAAVQVVFELVLAAGDPDVGRDEHADYFARLLTMAAKIPRIEGEPDLPVDQWAKLSKKAVSSGG